MNSLTVHSVCSHDSKPVETADRHDHGCNHEQQGQAEERFPKSMSQHWMAERLITQTILYQQHKLICWFCYNAPESTWPAFLCLMDLSEAPSCDAQLSVKLNCNPSNNVNLFHKGSAIGYPKWITNLFEGRYKKSLYSSESICKIICKKESRKSAFLIHKVWSNWDWELQKTPQIG